MKQFLKYSLIIGNKNRILPRDNKNNKNCKKPKKYKK